ncbi:MAG: hypothetical protein M1840_007972 [Geoglossum simile]|nr:MAG: hypothetical protein M1840_007972 [Geoglossum simile]
MSSSTALPPHEQYYPVMGGKKALGENSKKAAGNARKAESAAKKAAEDSARKAQFEDQEWSKGAKSSAKKEAADAKKAEAARKKAERDALIAEEEKALKSAKPSKDKSAAKKPAKPLSLTDLDSDNDLPSSSSTPALNATGIDNALDLLSLTTSPASSQKVERHPERRFKAALAAYEARRMPEIEAENPGLRLQQRRDVLRREFEKSGENPFNQVTARFDASKGEVEEVRRREREGVEGRLADK